MVHGGPVLTPYVWEALDYQQNAIRITVNFDNATRALSGASAFRDSACVYRHIYIGTGADGTPDSTPRVVHVPAGTTPVTAQQLHNVGLDTIEDFLALQITAGP